MSSGQFSTSDLLNMALKIVSEKGSRTRTANINNLLEVLESEREEEGSIYLVAVFALRQAARGFLDNGLAMRLSRDMIKIASSDLPNKKQVARKYLGLVKWLFETTDRMRLDLKGIENFDQLVERLGGVR